MIITEHVFTNQTLWWRLNLYQQFKYDDKMEILQKKADMWKGFIFFIDDVIKSNNTSAAWMKLGKTTVTSTWHSKKICNKNNNRKLNHLVIAQSWLLVCIYNTNPDRRICVFCVRFKHDTMHISTVTNIYFYTSNLLYHTWMCWTSASSCSRHIWFSDYLLLNCL